MPRIPRMLITDEPAVYHLMSRTALDGFVLQDQEKTYLMDLIIKMSQIFFVEVLGFCIMGNHFHLLVRMFPGDHFDDQEILKRFTLYYGPDIKPVMTDEKLESFRQKWSNLSEYMREIKQRFSRFYNKQHERKGYFWGDRFKSVIVENGDTLINCLAYIDLNPVRAGLCKKPEEYRWCSLGYHHLAENSDNFLSLDFGLTDHKALDEKGRLEKYKQYLYEKAGISDDDATTVNKPETSRLLQKCRYFTDSAIIGTRKFVIQNFKRFRNHFFCRNDKNPIPISGLNGIFSLKRLSE